MKRFSSCYRYIIYAVLMCMLVGCSNVGNGISNTTAPSTESSPPSTEPSTKQQEKPSTKPNEEIPQKKKFSILFIGNSYTYTNDMPTAYFQKFAEAAGYEVEVTSITKGSHKLYQFADPSDTYGAQVQKALTGSKKYDFVILQEQSIRPATDNVSDFYDAVRNLSERIRATGAQPILYSTWGRQTGNSTLDTYGWTNESMTWKLAAAYQAIGNELNIPVAHVGLAFYDVYTHQTSINLYNSDKTHPSSSGSYLAAVTLFAKIFECDPTEITFRGNISANNAKILRQAAKDAVFNTPKIPSQYQTTSEGISTKK